MEYFKIIIIRILLPACFVSSCNSPSEEASKSGSNPEEPWYGWNQYQIKPEDTLVRLGYKLISNTAYYFGPKGMISTAANGMNCQNCHLQGGIIPWGNNFSATIMSYPSFSGRIGGISSLATRINGCFERSLNGTAIDTNSREMRAMIAYMHWIGDDISSGRKPLGSGIMKLPYLDRPADPVNGKTVFLKYCQRCHGKDGQGQLDENGPGFTYPPLWGIHSFNNGAGMYRISNLAGYVKNNMPFEEANYQHPVLTNEEAWDVAAFISSQPRPILKGKNDYPDISKKPIDDPFGPYADTFPEIQHKYGPFKPIAEATGISKK